MKKRVIHSMKYFIVRFHFSKRLIENKCRNEHDFLKRVLAVVTEVNRRENSSNLRVKDIQVRIE